MSTAVYDVVAVVHGSFCMCHSHDHSRSSVMIASLEMIRCGVVAMVAGSVRRVNCLAHTGMSRARL